MMHGSLREHNRNPLEAFVDALGVVIARILTMFAIGLLLVSPHIALALLFGHHSAHWFAAISTYSFLWLSTFMLIEYSCWLNGKEFSPDTQSPWMMVLIIIISVPALPFVILLAPFGFWIDRVTNHSFVKNSEFDVLMLFIMSVVAFCFSIHFLSSIDQLGPALFSTGGAISLNDSLAFTLDLVLKGVLFDVFEHFRLELSDVRQSDNIWGLALTFVLRVTSSALVLSIAVELFQATRRRMASTQRYEPPQNGQ